MTLLRTVRLRFGGLSRAATTHTNLSAVRVDGPVLWIAGDETATLERLVADDPDMPAEYADERTFRLADFVDLPGDDADEEADIEGLARTGHFLWAVGSHSLRRKRIKSHHDGPKALKRLARVEGQHNRQILVRLPVAEMDGLPTPVPEVVVHGERHRAAALGRRDDLRELLRDDEHLACECRKLIRASDLDLRRRTRSSCESGLNAFKDRASNLEHAQLQHTTAGDVSVTAQVTGLPE
jgi:hypothetical protein